MYDACVSIPDHLITYLSASQDAIVIKDGVMFAWKDDSLVVMFKTHGEPVDGDSITNLGKHLGSL